MDRELEALDKARGHVVDIAKLAKQAKEHLEEGRLEDAQSCLRMIEPDASIGNDVLRLLVE